MTDWLHKMTSENGQTMAEYSVVAAVIVIGVFLVIGALAVAVSGKYTSVTTMINALM
jgi:Flp pilus assembly pilin Flp